MLKCLICSNKIINKVTTGLTSEVKCPECGIYKITGSVEGILTGEISNGKIQKIKLANLSGWLRENQDSKINTKNKDSLLSITTPNVFEKANKLMIHLAKKQPVPGEFIGSDDVHKPLSLTWSPNLSERKYIVKDYLTNEKNYLVLENEGYKITPRGWSALEDILNKNLYSNQCFVAMCFDNLTDDLWNKALSIAIEDAGYSPLRIDLKQHNNNIVDEIIASIKVSKFMVADFTGNRGSVYYEAGYAKGMGIPVIYTCRDTGIKNKQNDFENLRFDVAQYNFIKWDENSYDDISKKLKDRIEATIGRGRN